MTSVAAKTAPKVEESRKVPEVKPENVAVNLDGMVHRTIVARMPADLILDDLKEPGVWRRVQRSHMSLRKLDEVRCIAFDETWIADCIVGHADAEKAILSKPRVTAMPERFDKLFEDDNYKVAWDGAQYAVVRKRDGHVMSRWANVPLAEKALAAIYPRPVQQ